MRPRRKLVHRLLWGAAIGLVALQFFRPARTVSSSPPGPDDFLAVHPAPEPFRRQLLTSCYDCHSDRPRYPWYANIQPVGWWLQHHVNEGRHHLNLSEFGGYSAARQADKLDEMIDELTFHTMPLRSYTLIHRDARLSPAEYRALADWIQAQRDGMDE